MTSEMKQFSDLLHQFDTAMLVTRHGDDLHARPMAIARADEDDTLWFITALESGKVDELLEHPEVAVTMQKGDAFLSLSGTARVRRDREKLEELWSPTFEPWFDRGIDDPQAVVLEVSGHSAEYWQQRKPQRLRMVYELAKSALKRERVDEDAVRDHGTVRL